jgi:DNA-binding Lrp family transcriptional regulator
MNLVEVVKDRGPISRADLAKALRVSERAVRQEIHELNRAGVPVVFTGKGFIHASERAEINFCANKLIAAGISHIQRAASLKKTDVEKMVRKIDFSEVL